MSIIEEDLKLTVLQVEYPRVKEALAIRYSEVGAEEIKRAINEISDVTYTAIRLLAKAQDSYTDFINTVYNPFWSDLREKALDVLEAKWKAEKRKATLTNERVDDYIRNHNADGLLNIETKKKELETRIKVLTGLFDRLKGRESLLQTYSRLFEKRYQVVLREDAAEGKK